MGKIDLPNTPGWGEDMDAEGPRTIVVGVGASAGGLEALRTLLTHLRPNGKIAIVVAQHLSPTHKSMLRALLERETTLTVTEIQSGDVPRPDTVYITPPNSDLEYRQGQLVLSMPQKAVGPKPSINRFFCSLAEELAEQSIGIILSGTGADGAEGLLAIHLRGGITIIQDPASAKYDPMPQAAQHGLRVDHSLPEPAIAELLLRYARDGSLPSVPSDDPATKTFATRIIDLVRDRTGFDLSAYKASTFQRRVRRRMDKLHLLEPEQYLAHLERDENEPPALAREILVSVTEFFRDVAAFEALEKALQRVVDDASSRHLIRVWNPGCATGEETYSIAMLLEEAFESRGLSPKFQIFATDIDERALQLARQGTFSAEGVVPIPSHLCRKYFTELGGFFTAVKPLRDRIIFSKHNLVTDPPFSRIDLISCRNLLIYLNGPLESQALRMFHYSLNPSGLLFLGQAETIDPQRDMFTELDRGARIFRSMHDPRRRYHFETGAFGFSSQPVASSQPRGRSRTTSVEDVARDLLLRTFAPPALVVSAQGDVVYAIGEVNSFLTIREGLVGTKVTSLIRDELRAELRALLFKSRRDPGVARGGTHRLGERSFRLTVQTLTNAADGTNVDPSLVAFESVPVSEPPRTGSPSDDSDVEHLRATVATLENEVSVTRDNLNTVVEELESANEELQLLNEELQSSNEELQSTNEELQTANEELQSTNEELLTVNDELQAKSRELEHTMEDVRNIVESSASPLLVVDRELRVRRFVHGIDAVIPVGAIHPGDLITALPWRVDAPGLRGAIGEVIALSERRELVLDVGERSYRLEITPFRNAGGETEGAVLWLHDVTELERTRRSLERSQSYLATIVDNVVDGIIIADERGTILTVNRAAEAMFGYAQKDLAGREIDVLVEAKHSTHHQGYIDRYLASGEKHIIGTVRELRGRRRTGEEFPLELGISEITFQGTRLFCGIMRDVSARKNAENQVRLLQEKAVATLACINDGIITLDAAGLVDYMNPVAETLTGVQLAEVQGQAAQLAYQVFDQASHERIGDIRSRPDPTSEGMADTLVLLSRRGNEYLIEQSLGRIVSSTDGQREHGTVIAFRDVSTKHRMLERMTWHACHDPLTGLVNRIEFETRLERALQSVKTFGRPHALIYIDLDQFKVINDTCGHRAGDDFLRQLCGHICVHLRARDTMARIGGDEFAVILENCALSQGEHVAGKLREGIQAFRFVFDDRVFKVGASIGVVEITDKLTSAAQALSLADVACYAAKESGRNRVLVYSPTNDLMATQHRQMDWLSRINAAVDEHRLRLYFQPIVPLKGTGARHWEVLLRMVEADDTLVLPGAFLPAAERYGLIGNIDRWVLAETLRLLHDNCHDNDFPYVSINLSTASLSEQSFREFARDAVRSHRGARSHICFEITETTAITSLVAVKEFMAEMKALGCQFALDDFGSGMCSYGYLRTLPADYVKIDGVFVKDIKHDSVNLAVVDSINRISQLMDLATIAECAEDEAIIEKLKLIGVDFVQGYGVGAPIPADEFVQHLQ
jgi:two-component system CheB/CheR fusion protein